MNSFLYRLLYFFGQARWDSGETPPEVIAAFQGGAILEGPALDLGCGTGTNVIYMAQQGRRAFGVDFVPQAILKAWEKTHRAGVTHQVQFYQADVTRLPELKLPKCAFALDMGCFHGLKEEDQQRYAQGLAEVLIPGGKYMLYVLHPRKQGPTRFGMAPEAVRAVFAPYFEIEREETGKFWDRGSTWFWMKRKW
jgi:SAM-dependent methyltransferase